ncbi:hypothetical protein VTN00DRAFT_6099 [Thermoascus crustaceus]|uniref:uncharacterized protein n=1 Tax=Thermoascus crustaceus TaxID=5088 RepID=UPI0037432C81
MKTVATAILRESSFWDYVLSLCSLNSRFDSCGITPKVTCHSIWAAQPVTSVGELYGPRDFPGTSPLNNNMKRLLALDATEPSVSFLPKVPDRLGNSAAPWSP